MRDFEERKGMLKKRRSMRMVRMIIAVIIFIVVGVAISIPFDFNDHTYMVTVTDKDRIVSGSGDSTKSKYLVFADDENGESMVFENTDTLLRMKWDSSNIQGALKEGHTYNITVVGFRLSFMSMYENILSIEEIKTEK